MRGRGSFLGEISSRKCCDLLFNKIFYLLLNDDTIRIYLYWRYRVLKVSGAMENT